VSNSQYSELLRSIYEVKIANLNISENSPLTDSEKIASIMSENRAGRLVYS